MWLQFQYIRLVAQNILCQDDWGLALCDFVCSFYWSNFSHINWIHQSWTWKQKQRTFHQKGDANLGNEQGESKYPSLKINIWKNREGPQNIESLLPLWSTSTIHRLSCHLLVHWNDLLKYIWSNYTMRYRSLLCVQLISGREGTNSKITNIWWDL